MLKKLASIAYLILLEMNDEQLSARPDGLLVSEGAVDGPLMNEEEEGRSSCVVDGAIDQGMLISEEDPRVHACTSSGELRKRWSMVEFTGG